MYKLNRIMGTLWLPFDNFNSCSTSSKSSICPRISWMDALNFLFGNCSSGDNLFIQLNISGVLEQHAQFGPLYDYISGQISIPIIYKKNRIRLSKYTTRIHSCYMSYDTNRSLTLKSIFYSFNKKFQSSFGILGIWL